MIKSPECLRPDAINPTQVLGESCKKVVFATNETQLAVKLSKEHQEKTFASAERAIIDIKQNQYARTFIRDAVRELGSSEDIVPHTDSVIHATDNNGGITYTEFQAAFHRSSSLADCRLSLLSTDALTDIRNLLRVSLKVYKEQGVVPNLVGSKKTDLGFLKRVIAPMFPLAFSQNIIIDERGIPRMIDIEKITTIPKTPTRLLTQFRRALGCYLSIVAIDILLFSRRISTKLGHSKASIEESQ